MEAPISWGGGSGAQARPHHIPKMNDALSERLDTIKKTMSLAPYQESPWDSKGVPIKKKKKEGAGEGEGAVGSRRKDSHK